MAKRKSNSWLPIDFGGSALTAGLLGLAAWMTWTGGGSGQQATELKRAIAASHRQLATLKTDLDAQRDLLAARQQELRVTGQLPEGAPVEQDLRAINDLASRHKVSVVRVAPLTPRSYPGLTELRYSLEAAGTISDLTRFFKAIEEASFWADVSHLKIETRAPADQIGAAGACNAQLTLSLFAAAAEKPAKPAPGEENGRG